MARRYKRFEEHSERWQKQARKEGIDSTRWNGWLKLSEKSRKESDPRKYGAGQSIGTQRIERKRAKAEQRINAARQGVERRRQSVVHYNVGRMMEKDLDWTMQATPQQIRERASKKTVPGYDSNPWWYR